jgi:hypothetical protein
MAFRRKVVDPQFLKYALDEPLELIRIEVPRPFASAKGVTVTAGATEALTARAIRTPTTSADKNAAWDFLIISFLCVGLLVDGRAPSDSQPVERWRNIP